jgi:hypothetical protein
VLARRVVEHDVDAQRHPVRAQLARELAQVVHRAQRRLDGAVVRDRVAAVVGLGPRVQERHQVQVGDAELEQVREPLADAGERAAEAVDVADVADRLLALQPVRRDLALVVQAPQVGVPRGRARGHRVEQRGELGGEALVVAVQRDERVAQLGVEALQPRQEGSVAGHPRTHLRELGADLRAHRVDVLHRPYSPRPCASPSWEPGSRAWRPPRPWLSAASTSRCWRRATGSAAASGRSGWAAR